MRMTNERLREVLNEHSKWLSSGKQEGCCANLSGVDLSCANLSGADLSGANLEDAYLKQGKRR